MKYALLFYGELRSYKKSYAKLKISLLDINDIDIFIHTYKYNTICSNSSNKFINIYKVFLLSKIHQMENIFHNSYFYVLSR